MDEIITLIIIYFVLFGVIPLIIGVLLLLSRFINGNRNNIYNNTYLINSNNILQNNYRELEKIEQLEKAQSDFFVAIKNFENLLTNFKYEILELSTYEKVFNINNSLDRKSTRLNSSHSAKSRMPSSA